MKKLIQTTALILLMSGVLTGARSQRMSITFIMGEDHTNDNRYYGQAESYYRYVPEAMTDFLVTHARSLYDVREHLECHSPDNNQPWGLINIVVHSNEWTGMETPVMPQGERVQKHVLEHYVRTGDFLELPDDLMDSKTELVVHGCALGRNIPLMESIATAFGGDDKQKPVVKSSKYFVFYGDANSNQVRRCLADFRYAHHPSFYRPDDATLAAQFVKKYPQDTLPWAELLTRDEPRFDGDFYHHTFRVPVKWIVTYADTADRPDLNKYRDQQAWLNKQPELMAAVKKLGMKKNDFMWTFFEEDYTFEDGVTEPAIKALGLCTIVCALQIITDPDNPNVALAANPDDTRYYSVVGGNNSP